MNATITLHLTGVSEEDLERIEQSIRKQEVTVAVTTVVTQK